MYAKLKIKSKLKFKKIKDPNCQKKTKIAYQELKRI